MRYSKTTRMWRFTWKRLATGSVLLRSECTGLYYTWSYTLERYVRSSVIRQIQDAARKLARTNL